MLCAYSIGAPIGAGLISREKHYHPLCQIYLGTLSNVNYFLKWIIKMSNLCFGVAYLITIASKQSHENVILAL